MKKKKRPDETSCRGQSRRRPFLSLACRGCSAARKAPPSPTPVSPPTEQSADAFVGASRDIPAYHSAAAPPRTRVAHSQRRSRPGLALCGVCTWPTRRARCSEIPLCASVCLHHCSRATSRANCLSINSVVSKTVRIALRSYMRVDVLSRPAENQTARDSHRSRKQMQ
jgi:hypothetical protein